MHRFRTIAILVALLVLSGVPLAANGGLGPQQAVAQTPPPEPPIIDNFNRPNEFPLAAPWNDRINTSPDNLLEVISNQLNCDRQTALCDAWRTDVRYGLDQDVMVTISVKPGDSKSVRLYARLQTPDSTSVDGYVLIYTDSAATDQVTIARMDADTTVPLTTFSQEFAADNKLRLRRGCPVARRT